MRKIILILLIVIFLISCVSTESIKKFRSEYNEDLKQNKLGVITDLQPLTTEDVLTSLLIYYYIQSFRVQPRYYYGVPIFYGYPTLIAGDGTYLGMIAYQTNIDSIFNQFGTYGNRYSSLSIWNQFGNYGNRYSQYSPFNPLATSPPEIYWNGVFVGYLTVNPLFINRINPYLFIK